MKLHLIKTFLAAAFTIAFTASCEEDTTLRYGNVTMGDMVDGTFISDQGNIFNIVEQTCPGNITEHDRALIICDVLQKTAESTYDIRLHRIDRVLVKECVAQDAANEEMAVEDPVEIYEAWCAGGYLNMYIVFYVNRNQPTSHMINLVYDVDGNGEYTFTLRHNAFGDVLSESNTDMILGGAYVSFPLTELMGDSAKFNLKWKWYSTDGSNLAETKYYNAELGWTKARISPLASKSPCLAHTATMRPDMAGIISSNP
jgi:hypothetical protein